MNKDRLFIIIASVFFIAFIMHPGLGMTSKVVNSLGSFNIQNFPPILEPIDNITINRTDLVSITPNATDPNGENVSFYFTPPLNSTGQWQTTLNDSGGDYFPLVIASDGVLNTSQIVKITVFCAENWSCTDWGPCTNDVQTRTCTDSNSCGTTFNKPSETLSCAIPTPPRPGQVTGPCIPSWTCSEWMPEPCPPEGIQRRNCTDIKSCGVGIRKPNETRTCIYRPPTCHDRIQNQGEEGIDCGGPCPPCPCETDADCAPDKECREGFCVSKVPVEVIVEIPVAIAAWPTIVALLIVLLIFIICNILKEEEEEKPKTFYGKLKNSIIKIKNRINNEIKKIVLYIKKFK
ncbi:hypothetical protein KY339_00905 [Candidatus Woesearchaeota archaeon]|nr:hypothetical protein [Candidatus Woesearchaeota archaeon]